VYVDLGKTLIMSLDNSIGTGIGYESRLNKNMTIVPNVVVAILDEPMIADLTDRTGGFQAGAGADFRYYVFGTALDKLFVGGGLGFTYSSVTYGVPKSGSSTIFNIEREDKSFSFGAVTVPLYVGWKAIFGKGFALEINAGYEVGITVLKPSEDDFPSSWLTAPEYGGALFGIHLGWAF
jgi:hypothetical protein